MIHRFARVVLVLSMLWLSDAALACGGIVHHPVPEHIVEFMKQHSWREGCPVPIKDLAYLRVPYWDYDGKEQNGALIVHREVAEEVKDIFHELHEAKFAIKKMRLVGAYEGSDDRSMADNNTSAFNCRAVTGKPGVFSRHSYGKAIDINPLTNPYVTKKIVLPKAGKKYTDRSKRYKGGIFKDDAVYQAFTSRGWTWGGDWNSLKDYQHFEKK